MINGSTLLQFEGPTGHVWACLSTSGHLLAHWVCWARRARLEQGANDDPWSYSAAGSSFPTKTYLQRCREQDGSASSSEVDAGVTVLEWCGSPQLVW